MEKWELDLDKLLNSGSTGNYKYCHVDQLVLGVREAKCEEVTWNYFTHVHFSNVYTEEKESIAYEIPDGSENKITIWSSDNKHRKKKLYASHYVMTKERFLQCVQSAMSSGVWNYTDSELKATNPIDEPISANIKYVPEIDPTGSGYDLVVPMEESLYGSNFRGNYYIFEIYAHGSHLKKMLNADDQKKIQQELEKRKIRYRLDRLTDRIGNIVCKFENEVLDMTPKRLGRHGIEIYFQLMENITSSVGLHIHTEQEHDGLVYECRDKSVELLPNERIGVVVAPNQSKTTITITDTETGLIQFRYRADRSLYSSYRGQISFPKRCLQIYQDGRRIVRDGKEQNVQLDDTQHFGSVTTNDTGKFLESHCSRFGLIKNLVLPLPEPPTTSTFLFRAFLGSGGRLDIIRRSVLVRMILSSNFGAMNGSISLGPPHRAEPYSMPWRYFLAFLPFR